VGDPALAAVVAVVGVVALVLRRRSRRTCARIERLLGAAGNGAP
jgi:MYXO-CTERM domain-containing protein